MTRNEKKMGVSRETLFIFYHETFSLQIFAKPFMSQETIPLQTLKEDYIYSLMKELQVHPTILFGKVQQETASSSLMEILMDGGLVQSRACLMVLIFVKVSIF